MSESPSKHFKMPETHSARKRDARCSEPRTQRLTRISSFPPQKQRKPLARPLSRQGVHQLLEARGAPWALGALLRFAAGVTGDGSRCFQGFEPTSFSRVKGCSIWWCRGSSRLVSLCSGFPLQPRFNFQGLELGVPG